MSGGPSPSAFSARTAILLVLVVAFAFSAFVVLLAYAPDLQSGNDRRATAISRSGVGFAGMVQLLRDMGDNPLVLRRAPPLLSADASPGLLILTPQAGQTTAAMQEIAWNGPILIILPKWTVREHPDRAGWVQRTGLAPVGLAQTLLGGYDPSLKLDRREGATNPTLQIGGRRVAVGPIRNLQTLRGPVWTPVVTDERGGAVLSRFARSQIYVLSDPDLMNNQGLRRLEVAEVAQALSLIHI